MIKDWNIELRRHYMLNLDGLSYDGSIIKSFYEILPNDVANQNDKIFIVVKSMVGSEDRIEKNGYNGTVNIIVDVIGNNISNVSIVDVDNVASIVKGIIVNHEFYATKTDFKIHGSKLINDQVLSNQDNVNKIYRRILRFENNVEQINYL